MMQVISRWDDMNLLDLPLAPGPPSNSLRVDAANVALYVRIPVEQRLAVN